VTGKIAPKDFAAVQVLAPLPDARRPVLSAARSVFLHGDGADELPSPEPVAAFVCGA